MRCAWGVVSAAIGCLAGLAFGATAQSGGAGSPPQTILHAQATTVVVDVVVRQNGKPVTGIDPKRFHIYDDNHEQTITFAEEHSPAAAPASQQFKSLPPHFYTNVPQAPASSAVNVLLLDGLNTPLMDQVEVRRQMLKYLATVEPGTMMAVFTLTSKLRMVQGFTSKSDDLVAAVKSTLAMPQRSAQLDEGGFNTDVSNLGMMQVPGPNMAALQQFQSGVTILQTDQRVGMTLTALQQLARYLSAIPGRKNLIWFSGSFPITLGGDASSMAQEEPRSYDAQVHATSEMLATARVAVYPIDTEGIMPLANFGLGPNDGMATPASTTAAQEHFAMEDLAKTTGGMVFFNNNDFRKAVATAIDDGSSYYTVAYTPDAKKFHGEFRKIKIRVDDCTCQLEYRSGYYAEPPGKSVLPQTNALITATLHGAPPATQVLFQARVLPASDAAVSEVKLPSTPLGEMGATLKQPARRFIADMVVDPHTIRFGEAKDGGHELALEFALIAYDRDGKRVNSMDRNLKADVSPAQYAQIQSGGVPVRMAIDVPSAPAYLVLAVHDVVGGRVGSLEIPLPLAGSKR